MSVWGILPSVVHICDHVAEERVECFPDRGWWQSRAGSQVPAVFPRGIFSNLNSSFEKSTLGLLGGARRQQQQQVHGRPRLPKEAQNHIPGSNLPSDTKRGP